MTVNRGAIFDPKLDLLAKEKPSNLIGKSTMFFSDGRRELSNYDSSLPSLLFFHTPEYAHIFSNSQPSHSLQAAGLGHSDMMQ